MQGRSLLSHFAELSRGQVRLGIAGKIRTPNEAERAFTSGVDFIILGKAAILHHDFPLQLKRNPDFAPVEPPVSVEYLKREGLSDKFVSYMGNWPGFVAT